MSRAGDAVHVSTSLGTISPSEINSVSIQVLFPSYHMNIQVGKLPEVQRGA